MTMTDSTTSLAAAAAAPAQRPLLLWLLSGFWLISGMAGIVLVMMAIPSISQEGAFTLLLASVAALSHLLSLAGAVQLFRRRRSAIPLLVVVFALYVGTLLYSSASPTNWGLFTICLVAISGGTVGYALLLKRKGALS